MTTDDLKTLVGLTLREPEAAARQLIALNLPLSVRWMGVLLSAALSGLLAWLSAQLYPVPEPEVVQVLSLITSHPLLVASLHVVPILVTSALMAGVGRMFGGKGSFEDALLLTVWIELVLLMVQTLQVVLTLVIPGVAIILGYVTLGLFFWLTVQFTKALHGFSSGAKVFLGMMGTAFVLATVVLFLAISAGVMPQLPQ